VSAGNLGCLWQKPQDGQGGQALAATALPDNRQDFTLLCRERYAVDNIDASDFDAKIFD
jgi:hypothetical protein